MPTPLMLQMGSGLDAGAYCWCLAHFTENKEHWLVRAKTKIRDGGIRLEITQKRGVPQQLDTVPEALLGGSRRPAATAEKASKASEA